MRDQLGLPIWHHSPLMLYTKEYANFFFLRKRYKINREIIIFFNFEIINFNKKLWFSKENNFIFYFLKNGKKKNNNHNERMHIVYKNLFTICTDWSLDACGVSTEDRERHLVLGVVKDTIGTILAQFWMWPYMCNNYL